MNAGMQNNIAAIEAEISVVLISIFLNILIYYGSGLYFVSHSRVSYLIALSGYSFGPCVPAGFLLVQKASTIIMIPGIRCTLYIRQSKPVIFRGLAIRSNPTNISSQRWVRIEIRPTYPLSYRVKRL